MEILGDKDVNKTLKEALKGVNNYWLSAGTALGLYRDDDFIKTDTDIDIEMWADDEYTLPEHFSCFVRRDAQGKPAQRAYHDTHNHNIVFDIYFYEKKGEMCQAVGDPKLQFPTKWFENKKKLKTKHGEYYFPSPIEEYLEHRYGKTWKTPSEKKGLFNGQF